MRSVFVALMIVVSLAACGDICPANRATATDPRCYIPGRAAVLYNGNRDAGPTEFIAENGEHVWYAIEAHVVYQPTGRVFHCPYGVELIAPVLADWNDICAQGPVWSRPKGGD